MPVKYIPGTDSLTADDVWATCYMLVPYCQDNHHLRLMGIVFHSSHSPAFDPLSHADPIGTRRTNRSFSATFEMAMANNVRRHRIERRSHRRRRADNASNCRGRNSILGSGEYVLSPSVLVAMLVDAIAVQAPNVLRRRLDMARWAESGWCWLELRRTAAVVVEAAAALEQRVVALAAVVVDGWHTRIGDYDHAI